MPGQGNGFRPDQPWRVDQHQPESAAPLLKERRQSIGRGIAVKVGEKFGLRIDQILPREETIRSLG